MPTDLLDVFKLLSVIQLENQVLKSGNRILIPVKLS